MKKFIKKVLRVFRRPINCNLTINYNNNKEYLKDKNIVITGGTSGIGYDIAKRATSLGANVLIVGRDKEKLEIVKNELNCKIVEWDISNTHIAENKICEIIDSFNGSVDCLINNAGVYDNKPCLDTDEELYDKIMNTNLKAGYFISKEMIRQQFISKNEGNIIFISSNRGIFGDDCVYGISKAGIINFTRGLAKKYLGNNIRVNSIAPGMTTSNINGIKDTDNLYYDELKGKRVLSSREIAEVAMFLISDASKCITGQTIVCDNGESVL